MNPVANMHNPRNSKMIIGEVYFWTDTIKDWRYLLQIDRFKHVILSSLKFLIKRNKIKIYGYVIMPNHLHIIWEMIDKNGNEMPYASFNKYTSHQFLNDLKNSKPEELRYYKQQDVERTHRFWQRDALAVLLDSREKIEQKLDYIHLNPLQEKWNLVEHPEDYPWSSAKYYEDKVDEFGFLTHYLERF